MRCLEVVMKDVFDPKDSVRDLRRTDKCAVAGAITADRFAYLTLPISKQDAASEDIL